MVGFVREGFEQAIQSGSLTLQEALEIVERYPHVIFRRIRIHLIGQFADQNVELTRRTMLTRELFDDYHYKHEYAMLVGRRLDLLTRKEWFSWVDAGSDKSNLDQAMKRMGHDTPTEDERQKWIENWQFSKLHWVRGHLEGTRRNLYEKLHSQYSEPELADLNVRVSIGWTGDESSMTVEQLGTMPFEQVVKAVASWRPEEPRLTGPSIIGLASTFEQYVATNAEQFSTNARTLVDRPAIFVQAFINQMTEAVKAVRDIDLPAVLDLCD